MLVDRLSTILGRADGSDGYLGGVPGRRFRTAVFICVTGEAHPGKVVGWVLKLQLTGPWGAGGHHRAGF